jgi:hypothetical protein
MSTLVRSAAPDWTAAWAQALDDLELDVLRAEQLLRAVHGAGEQPDAPRPWDPPANLGPLPETMLERAQQVHARQLEVTTQLAAAAVRSRRDLDLARRIEGTPAPSRPLFVDAAF